MVKRFFITLSVILFLLCACTPGASEPEVPLEGEPFELYLLSDQQIRGADLKNYAVEKLPLMSFPLITTDEVASYDWDNHGLNLIDDAYFKLLAVFYEGIPLSGAPFVIKAYEQPIYAGAFWAPVSSLSFDGVVILQPLDPAGQTLYIDLGYPSTSNFTGDDPRNNPRLHQALEDAGLLK